MAGSKPLDSNFFIFLPHVFTSEPVSDIENGPRYSCFVGELLNFFLIAQFRGKSQANPEDLNEWKSRLLRLCTSVSVSCVDLTSRTDDEHSEVTGGFNTCSPNSSSRIKLGQLLDEGLVTAGSPIVTSRGDIVYPLNVSLDVLPALSKRIRLSVNVWTPELNAAINIRNGLSWDNYLDYFINNDPDDALGDLQTSFRCHVNATLPVVPPPSVRCRYTRAIGKHYLLVEVINNLGEPITLHKVCVHSSSYMVSRRINHNGSIDNLNLGNSQRRLSLCHTIPLLQEDGQLCKCPLVLHPWECSSFLFKIVYPQNNAFHKSFNDELMSAVTWSVETLTLRHQNIITRYMLPLFNIEKSSVTVRAHARSSIEKGKRFQVTYTITNSEDEDCNVFLVWQPNYHNAAAPGIRKDSQALLCLQPTIKIGSCPPGSSQAVQVEFFAIQQGLHEVGQFMLCKWHTDTEDMGGTRKGTGHPRGLRGLTTISHSCQVFVVDNNSEGN